MKTVKMTLALSLVVALVATSFAWAADGEGGRKGRGGEMRANRGGMMTEADREKLKNMTPEERREFLRKKRESMTPEQREAMQKRRQGGQGGGQAGHPIIERFLRQNEEFKAAMETHKEAMKSIGEELRALQDATRKKMQDKELTKEEREQILNDAKTQSRALLGKILDERVSFQNKVTALIEKNREEILDQATGMIFQQRGKRGGRGGEAGKRGGRGGEGGEGARHHKRGDQQPDADG